MKIKVRKSIFETNSSSCHTLSLNISKIKDNYIDKSNIEITIGENKYTWGYDELFTWREKADYLGVYLYLNHEDAIKRRNLLIEVIKKRFPNIKITFSENGHIDHQSQNQIWKVILEMKHPKKTLYNIIFGYSKFIISNDNI